MPGKPVFLSEPMGRLNCGKPLVRYRWLFVTGLATIFAIAGLSISGYGNTLVWTGGGADGNWNDSANWGFAGIPGNGDVLVFKGATRLNSTNNIANLALSQIQFASGGFNMYGDDFTLTNSIQATNTSGAETIYANIILAASDVQIVVSNGASLTLSGQLSGTGGVVKTGAGSLTYQNTSGSNPYSGTTLVTAGTLYLNVVGTTALGGPLVIGDGTGTGSPMVQDVQGFELENTGPITINLKGTLNLNGFYETIDINPNLVLDGGTIETGSGVLTLSPNTTITTTNYSDSYIEGNLNIGSGTLTIQGDGIFLFFLAAVSGSANIIQNGSIDTDWVATNSYTGDFTANGSGYVWIENSLALGNTNNTLTLNGQSWVVLDGNINVTNQALVINSSYSSGAIYVYATSTNSWKSSFMLGSACTINVQTNCALTLNLNQISGAGGFTKLGPGGLTLSGPANVSSYTGDTIVNEGSLFLNSVNVIRHGTLMIGDGVGGAVADVVRYLSNSCIYGGPGGSMVVISSSGWLDLNGFFDDVGPITMDGAAITTGTGQLQLFPPLTTIASTNGSSSINGNFQLIQDSSFVLTNDLLMYANVTSSGSHLLTKTGPGFLYLTSSNSYSGTNLIQQGWVFIQNGSALGSATNSTIVANGATLAMSGNFTVSNTSLTLNGPGEPTWGALDSETADGTNLWVGSVYLNADSTMAPYQPGTMLRILGSISGPGGLSEFTSTFSTNSVLSLEGITANTYSGVTTVSSGILVLDKASGTPSVSGNLVVSGSNCVVNLASKQQIANSSDVLIGGGGLLDCSSNYTYLDTLHGLGTVNFGVNGWIYVGLNNGTSEFDGSFTGVGYAPGFTVGKSGTGSFTIGGNSTYTAGSTYAYEGKLVINGSQPLIPVAMEADATLSGSGTIGSLVADGIVSPGNSVGILTCGNINFSSTGDFMVELTGPNPGINGYDQLNAAGPVYLGLAALVVTPAFTTPVAVGQQFDILNNNGGAPINGTFNGLAEGAVISSGGYNFSLSYQGGTGNDVVLTLTGIPGAVESASVTAGNGNHAIDPNECNSLDLTVTNNTGLPMNAISATLSTTSEGVLITQPYSDYADIAANSRGTNAFPFQISTLPGFVCGSAINLQLSVNSSLGSFTAPFVLATGEASVTPFRYDVTGDVPIPPDGMVNSTNSVSGFTGFPLENVMVSVYLTDTLDSDLANLSLIAPDGTTVLLSAANGGSGQNYGSALTPDSSRTTFDDAAAAAITNGLAPFVGIFRPQSPLTAFIGNQTPNGNWHLHLASGAGGSSGTLHGWSLFLYPVDCANGGGNCDVCTPVISDSITAASRVQTNRWNRDGIVASCGSPKAWSGFGDSGTNFHYNAYFFTNTSGGDTCVTVELQSTNDVMAATYLFGFDPTSITNNFWAAAGFSTAEVPDGTTTYSAEIPNGAEFVVVVNEVIQASGTQSYNLTLSGLPCPPPALNIENIKPNQTRIFWPTWAGGYSLEATPSLANISWTGVTNEPIVSASHFNVTNAMNPTNQFYRLYRP